MLEKISNGRGDGVIPSSWKKYDKVSIISAVLVHTWTDQWNRLEDPKWIHVRMWSFSLIEAAPQVEEKICFFFFF